MGFFSFIKRSIWRLFSRRQVPSRQTHGKTYGPLKFIFKKNYGLSYETEEKAVNRHNKLLHQFIRNNKRGPTRYELGRIIVNASHVTIKYRKGMSGHWGRQKVRHYLFNLYGISYIKR